VFLFTESSWQSRAQYQVSLEKSCREAIPKGAGLQMLTWKHFYPMGFQEQTLIGSIGIT
jgi:hypothetical protein